jgi:hydroxymethylglutaryl-CoA lyase
MLNAIKEIPIDKLAAHFHDTYDKALPNIFTALENGISVIDSSVGGLGIFLFNKKIIKLYYRWMSLC